MRTLTICQSWLFSRQDLIFFFPHQKLEQALPYNLKKRLLHVNSLPRQGIVDEHATLTLTNKFKKKIIKVKVTLLLNYHCINP